MNCQCHDQPKVFKGGCWRCAVKFSATVKRYCGTPKDKARQRRRDLKRNKRRLYVAGRYVRMPTVELKHAAIALVAKRREEFTQRIACHSVGTVVKNAS